MNWLAIILILENCILFLAVGFFIGRRWKPTHLIKSDKEERVEMAAEKVIKDRDVTFLSQFSSMMTHKQRGGLADDGKN